MDSLKKGIFADRSHFFHYCTKYIQAGFRLRLGYLECSPNSWVSIPATKFSSKNDKNCAYRRTPNPWLPNRGLSALYDTAFQSITLIFSRGLNSSPFKTPPKIWDRLKQAPPNKKLLWNTHACLKKKRKKKRWLAFCSN